jgi:membrane associated rhomboid family serine protease
VSARRIPFLTGALVVAALYLLLDPQAAARLSFERALLASEPWRAVTGHLVHRHGALAAVDLAVLAGLGDFWELRSRRLYVRILLASAGLASLALLALSDFSRYVGSSALSSGLFVAAALEFARATRPALRRVAWCALALFAAKCALEALGEDALSLVSLPEGTRVAACAHWAGGIGGALAFLAWRRVRKAPMSVLEPRLHERGEAPDGPRSAQ